MYSLAVVSAFEWRRCAWMSFNRIHALRLSRHRPAHHLKIQFGKAELFGQRIQNAVSIVPRIHESVA